MMNISDPFLKTDLPATATDIIRRRYQRLAPFYDSMEALSERRYSDWRRQLWALVQGSTVLEVGVGTGKNMPFYPTGVEVTGIDLTPGMLDHARLRLQETDLRERVTLQLGDAQALIFSDGSFDSAVATFVFCSVPDPILGLREMKRVVKPGGNILLLEHMRSPNPFWGRVMDTLNPLVVRMMGANINRHTLENIQKVGLELKRVENLGMGGVFKLIVAQTPTEDKEL